MSRDGGGRNSCGTERSHTRTRRGRVIVSFNQRREAKGTKGTRGGKEYQRNWTGPSWTKEDENRGAGAK